MSLTDNSTKDNNINSNHYVKIWTSGRSLGVPGYTNEGEDYPIVESDNIGEQLCKNIPDIETEDFFCIDINLGNGRKKVPILDTERLKDELIDELTTILDACLVNEKQKQAVFRLCANCVSETVDDEVDRVLENCEE